MGRRKAGRITFTALLPLLLAAAAAAQSVDGGGAFPSSGSVTTPRPINPATGTTNPSARATQTLNPYLGSTSDDKVLDGEIKLKLSDAISRGLRFNLGLIDSEQADAGVVSKEYLHRYLWQFDFLWNGRKLNDGERTALAIRSAEGKRMMYRQPIAS